MGPGGIDEFEGNGQDTDNNSSDFVPRLVPQPQNSQSAEEPITPTVTPTLSPTPSETPTEAPTLSPSPSPTVEPTATPSPSPEPSPTSTINPTPTPKIIARWPNMICSINYKSIRIFNIRILFPFIQCVRT